VKYARPVESPKGFPTIREIPQGKHFTPVEHPEGTRFNGARGVNISPRLNKKSKTFNWAPRCGIFDPEGRDLRFASTGAVNIEHFRIPKTESGTRKSAERRTPETSTLKLIAACY